MMPLLEERPTTSPHILSWLGVERRDCLEPTNGIINCIYYYQRNRMENNTTWSYSMNWYDILNYWHISPASLIGNLMSLTSKQLIIRKWKHSWGVALLANVCWIVYGYLNKDAGIFVFNTGFAIQSAFGWMRWLKDHKREASCQEVPTRSSPGNKK